MASTAATAATPFRVADSRAYPGPATPEPRHGLRHLPGTRPRTDAPVFQPGASATRSPCRPTSHSHGAAWRPGPSPATDTPVSVAADRKNRGGNQAGTASPRGACIRTGGIDGGGWRM
jgi:hypothetical protein